MLRATAAVAFTLVLSLAASARAATLPQLFPELADLSDATRLTITFEWDGLSPVAPVASRYALELHGDQFTGTGSFSVGHPAVTASRAITVPRAAVQALLAAAGSVALDEKAYSPRITHTDDFPSLAVIVPTKQEPLLLLTRSQEKEPPSAAFTDRTPWGVSYMGRVFVVTASDLDQAVEQLEPHLQRDEVVKELVDLYKSRQQPRDGPGR
jgi:hypothetical protein